MERPPPRVDVRDEEEERRNEDEYDDFARG
jgi:hypothetical protein